MTRIPALLCTLLLLASCAREEHLTFETVTLESDPCKDCPEVRINLPQAVENTKIGRAINTGLKEEVIALLSFADSLEVTSLEQAITSFRKGYEHISGLYPDETPGWKAEVDARVSYQDAHWISIVINTYTFTGGAHGYGSVRYLNFDKRKGTELAPWELFSDEEGFQRLAEGKFREQEKIPRAQPINSTGFMFEENRFHLPENIGLCPEGVKLYYNQYEVASYADGPIELTLPFDVAATFLHYPIKS